MLLFEDIQKLWLDDENFFRCELIDTWDHKQLNKEEITNIPEWLINRYEKKSYTLSNKYF